MEDKVMSFFGKNNIDISDIMYLTHSERKTHIHLIDGRVVDTFINLKSILEELSGHDFVSISKGVAVSKCQIDHIDNFTYYMKDGTTLEGRRRTMAAHKKLNEAIQSEKQSEISEMWNKFSALDNMPVAFCVIELVINKNNVGMDFIFRYCNKQMEIVENKKFSEMMNQSFFKVFPNADAKWLAAYTEVAVNGGVRYIKDYSPEIDKNLLITCYQPMEGYCACLLMLEDDLVNSAPAIPQ